MIRFLQWPAVLLVAVGFALAWAPVAHAVPERPNAVRTAVTMPGAHAQCCTAPATHAKSCTPEAALDVAGVPAPDGRTTVVLRAAADGCPPGWGFAPPLDPPRAA